MLFSLRSAFVQTLQAKALLIQTQENLDYYNKELDIFRSRFQAGGIARVDLDRMLLQRVQYESGLPERSGKRTHGQDHHSPHVERPDTVR